MKPNPITKARFDALCVVRMVGSENSFPEFEWWSVDLDRLLGVICFYPSDDTWSWMILGRDTDGLFRGINQGHDLESQALASRNIQAELSEMASSPQRIFPQDDVERPGNVTNLLTPVVSMEKLFPHFRTLIETSAYSSAKDLLREFSPVFTDVDGNFVEQFQTGGFNPRLWELYLDLMLREQGFHRIKEFDRPDFCVIKHDISVGIEAVTINPSDKHPMPDGKSPGELREILEEFMPMRFSGPLNTKLGKRYWELPHMSGVPIVIAIQNFFTDQSMMWSNSSLIRYLYGMHTEGFQHEDGTADATCRAVNEHVWGEKTLISGFFNLPDAENISAVIANPCATLSQFNRMGKEAGLGDPRVRMVRIGNQWDPNPKAAKPIEFEYEVSADTPRESWSGGLCVFMNPECKEPVATWAVRGWGNSYNERGAAHTLLAGGTCFRIADHYSATN